MRYVPIIAGLGVLVASVGLVFSVEWFSPAAEPKTVDPEAETDTEEELRESLAHALVKARAAASERGDAKLRATVTELETRLQALEEAGKDEADESANTTEGEPSDRVATITEADLGDWIDNSLLTQRDGQITRSAKAALNKSMDDLPELNVEDVGCDSRFCRATFFTSDGSAPELRKLLGRPPFDTEGFTVPTPDGRVAVYFASETTTLDGLREQAIASRGR